MELVKCFYFIYKIPVLNRKNWDLNVRNTRFGSCWQYKALIILFIIYRVYLFSYYFQSNNALIPVRNTSFN